MFGLIKQVLIGLLGLADLENVSLNNKLCIIRPILIDLDPVELNPWLT